ncbi:MAG: hypothetical protein A3J92_04960 [Planctomycetes bacterium RIFOXYC2_FULL_41_27]|nr:MAG: hypothetical protein A3J92_04960 [Planctomycetes bacterium RIFOXYC2_FULL_41_27]
MRRISYILFLCILVVVRGERLFYPDVVYGEEAPITDKEFSGVNAVEGTEEGTKEIRIRKDEFDEIVGQLQGMKALLESMKQDYDTRFKEMQEKFAILEKENTELKITQLEPAGAIHELPLPKIETEFAVREVNSKTQKVSGKNEEEKTIPSQTDTSTSAPLSSQITAESMIPSTNTIPPDQPISSPPGQWSPAQPLTVWSMGKNYMNISFDGLFSAAGSTAEDLEKLETGGHDPNQRGFTVQNLETVFEGAIDPYFKGQANIVFQIDKDGESFLEVEEAYLTSMSLPLNLQVKAGTFFTEFGRLNQFHPHAWDFADQPLVNGRFLSPDGLRNPGARLSWLAPTSNYTELFIAVQDSQGETVRSFRNEEALFGREAVETRVRNMGDMLYVPRIATSFDLTDEQTILLGASAAFGPNSTGTDENTLIYGLDMFWKWKSKYAAGGFPFVTWQTEVMGRRFEAGEDINAGLPDEVMNNWGTYSQIMWGFKKRWVAGLRGDYVDGEEEATDPLGFERWRMSPNLTFYPSEFSKIRLQYNYDDILEDDSTEHSVFLQFEFLLGSHGAHKF